MSGVEGNLIIVYDSFLLRLLRLLLLDSADESLPALIFARELSVCILYE